MHISIIVPFYNARHTLQRCVQSIFSQRVFTMPSGNTFDLWLVDDGSEDGSLEVTEALNPPEQLTVHYLRLAHQGESVARNRGVEQAKGDWVTFLDADDYWHPDYLLNMLQMPTLFPEAALYSCKYKVVNEGRFLERVRNIAWLGKRKQINGFQCGYINYLRSYAEGAGTPICNDCVLVKREVYLALGGFDERLTMCADFLLYAQVALLYKVAYLDCSLAYYDQDSNTQQVSKQLHAPERHAVFHTEILEKHFPNEDLLRALHRFRTVNLRAYFHAPQYRKRAWQEMRKSFHFCLQ